MDNLADALSVVAVSKPKMVNGKFRWPGGPTCKQHFSLPPSLMYWIARNPPSKKFYKKKLVPICKYFFESNPILFASDLDDDGKKLCPNDNYTCGEGYRGSCCVKIDLKKLKSKIWLTNRIKIDDNIDYSLLCSKLYCRDELFQLSLSRTSIRYNQFKFLASSVRKIDLYDVKITDNDGKTVVLEKVVEAVPNLGAFKYWFDGNDLSMVTTSTWKNIAELKKDFWSFKLWNIPEMFFDVNDLSAFIKDRENTKFDLSFANDISDEYKNQLDVLIDEIIESENWNRDISYRGMNREKYEILKELSCDFSDEYD